MTDTTTTTDTREHGRCECCDNFLRGEAFMCTACWEAACHSGSGRCKKEGLAGRA